jgi:hypothetical protein
MSSGFAGPVRFARKPKVEETKSEQRTYKRTVITLSVVALAFLTWRYGFGKTSQVAKLKAQMEAIQKLPDDQRREKMAELRPQMEALSRDERRELFSQNGGGGRGPFGDLAAYFKLPPEKRVAYLDDQIKKSEQRRKDREKQPANNSNANNRGASSLGPGGPSAAARLEGLKGRLDNSTPDQRAMRGQYIADMNARRAQLGLPPTGRR